MLPQAKAFSASKQAYTAGDGASAHDLSVQGKEHQRNKDRYNDQAAAWIFNGASSCPLLPRRSSSSRGTSADRVDPRPPAENNKVQPPGSIDLHGLYVQEAIEYTERAIAVRRRQPVVLFVLLDDSARPRECAGRARCR